MCRKDRRMSSELPLGCHPENGEGKLSLAKRNVCQLRFSQTAFECVKGGGPVEWKPSCVGGKGSEMGQGLPSICHMTTTTS